MKDQMKGKKGITLIALVITLNIEVDGKQYSGTVETKETPELVQLTATN